MAAKESMRVELEGVNNKRQITAVFAGKYGRRLSASLASI